MQITDMSQFTLSKQLLGPRFLILLSEYLERHCQDIGLTFALNLLFLNLCVFPAHWTHSQRLARRKFCHIGIPHALSLQLQLKSHTIWCANLKAHFFLSMLVCKFLVYYGKKKHAD